MGNEVEYDLYEAPRYAWLKDMVAQSLWCAWQKGAIGNRGSDSSDEELEECINIALIDAFNLGWTKGTKLAFEMHEEINDIEACIPINTDTRIY